MYVNGPAVAFHTLSYVMYPVSPIKLETTNDYTSRSLFKLIKTSLSLAARRFADLSINLCYEFN